MSQKKWSKLLSLDDSFLGVGLNHFLFSTPIWGRWTQVDEHIFQPGWFNHQLVLGFWVSVNIFSVNRLGVWKTVQLRTDITQNRTKYPIWTPSKWPFSMAEIHGGPIRSPRTVVLGWSWIHTTWPRGVFVDSSDAIFSWSESIRSVGFSGTPNNGTPLW